MIRYEQTGVTVPWVKMIDTQARLPFPLFSTTSLTSSAAMVSLMAEDKPNLRVAYQTLDPAKPLEGPTLWNYYAQRPGAPTARLAEEIKQSSQPFRAIMAGQRGVGKTTELNWLKGDLQGWSERVFVFDLGRVATTNAVTALAYLTKELVLQTKVMDPGELVKQNAAFDWDFGIIGAVLDPSQLTNTLGTFKRVVTAIQQQPGPALILLLDGWERVGSNDEVYPFMDALERVNCSTVLVTRLSVILDPRFNRFRDDWDPTVLPAISLFTYDRASVDTEGWYLLINALEKRAVKRAFDASAIEIIIQASGGVFRELISLGRHACLLAERAQKGQVDCHEADAALRVQRVKHTATLTREDLGVIRSFAAGERIWTDPSSWEQVNQGRIVAYDSDRLWYDVHPILWPLLGLRYPQPPPS
jgi:hypothetical protein